MAVVAAAVLPGLVGSEPGYVNDVIVAADGGAPAGDIGGMQTVLNLGGIGYLAGGLLFGIALYRARILARWAAALLAVGTAGSPRELGGLSITRHGDGTTTTLAGPVADQAQLHGALAGLRDIGATLLGVCATDAAPGTTT